MDRSESLIEKMETLSGFDIQWKRVTSGKTGCGFSAKHTYHGCAFCKAVKLDPTRFLLCSQNDVLLIPKRAEEERKPFIHTCHAGVSELVIPFFKGDCCTEAFLAGIFRKSGACCPYPDVARKFSSVVLESKLHPERWCDVLTELAVILRERKKNVDLENVKTGIRDPRIQKILEWIDRKFSEKICVREAASMIFLSESRFIHLFRKETGVSFSAYIMKLRMEEARQLLELAEFPIKDIMERCGFNDQSRFGKLFKEFSGFSPLAYRKKFIRPRNV